MTWEEFVPKLKVGSVIALGRGNGLYTVMGIKGLYVDLLHRGYRVLCKDYSLPPSADVSGIWSLLSKGELTEEDVL